MRATHLQTADGPPASALPKAAASTVPSKSASKETFFFAGPFEVSSCQMHCGCGKARVNKSRQAKPQLVFNPSFAAPDDRAGTQLDPAHTKRASSAPPPGPRQRVPTDRLTDGWTDGLTD